MRRGAARLRRAAPTFFVGELVLEVEAVAGLDLGVFLFHGEMELVVADGGVGLVWE